MQFIWRAEERKRAEGGKITENVKIIMYISPNRIQSIFIKLAKIDPSKTWDILTSSAFGDGFKENPEYQIQVENPFFPTEDNQIYFSVNKCHKTKDDIQGSNK